jgi:phage N-6-adenine-methyltransferase
MEPIAKTGPSINKGNSKQNYQTPKNFMAAVHQRYGHITWDLAADSENHQADRYYTIQDDSLKRPWHKLDGLLWLNPPFKNIGDWAEKCYLESLEDQVSILFLVPNSTGANWFRDFVHNKAYVNLLNGRLTFVGCKDPYPKDMILAHFGAGPGYGVWDWKHKHYAQ